MLRADAKCIHVDCEIHIAEKIENKCEVNCALIKSFESFFFILLYEYRFIANFSSIKVNYIATHFPMA